MFSFEDSFSQHFCAACGSEHIPRNGSAEGHAKYQCKGCGHQARFTPAAVVKAVQYVQFDDLLRAQFAAQYCPRDGRLAGDDCQSDKKAQAASPALPRLRPKKEQKKEWEALELNEMWTFVGQWWRKVWLWLGVERANWRIVAWVLGRRDAATARRLWLALPPALSPPLLVFDRPMGGLCGSVVPLAPSPLPQR